MFFSLRFFSRFFGTEMSLERHFGRDVSSIFAQRMSLQSFIGIFFLRYLLIEKFLERFLGKIFLFRYFFHSDFSLGKFW